MIPHRRKTMAETHGRIIYGPEQADGSRMVFATPNHSACPEPIGRLMPPVSERTLEASPGIQSWSHPRGKVSTALYDGGATILSFSDYCKRHLLPTYPHTRSNA